MRTANGQLNLIPNGLDPTAQQRIKLIKAVLQQQVDPPQCVKLLEQLALFENSVVEPAAWSTLLIMYLRLEYIDKSTGLLDEHEAEIRKITSEEDWKMIEAALVSAYDAPSGAKLYSEVMQDAEQEMDCLQKEVESSRAGTENCDDEDAGARIRKKLVRKEAKLSTVKLTYGLTYLSSVHFTFCMFYHNIRFSQFAYGNHRTCKFAL